MSLRGVDENGDDVEDATEADGGGIHVEHGAEHFVEVGVELFDDLLISLKREFVEGAHGGGD